MKKNNLKYWTNELSNVEDIILRCFFPEGEEITIQLIKKRSGYSYERVYNSLKMLVKRKLISEKYIGKTLVYTLDFNNSYSKLAFSHYMVERIITFSNKHFIVSKALKKLETTLGMVIVFGSYSKGKETKSSDIDLIIVSDSQDIKKTIQGLIYEYGLNISGIYIPNKEFTKIQIENKELWADLKQNALVFNGIDWFYFWMYNNERL